MFSPKPIAQVIPVLSTMLRPIRTSLPLPLSFSAGDSGGTDESGRAAKGRINHTTAQIGIVGNILVSGSGYCGRDVLFLNAIVVSVKPADSALMAERSQEGAHTYRNENCALMFDSGRVARRLSNNVVNLCTRREDPGLSARRSLTPANMM